MLFSTKERTILGPMTELEGPWEYLDRSGKPQAARIREFLNQWVAQYPAEHRENLVSRIQSKKDGSYEGASFELIVFALLKALGCSVQLEPTLPNGSLKRPDFLATTPTGEQVYVEATVASAASDEDLAAIKREKRIYAAIQKLHSPDYSINVRFRKRSLQSPSERALRHFLRTWLGSLDCDAVFREIVARKLAGAPTILWQDSGWAIEFQAMARPPERRGLGQRVVGIRWGDFQAVNDWQPIRDAIKRKGARYGNLPHPYLVAINVDAFSMDVEDEVQAFFGQEEVMFSFKDGVATPWVRLKPDGVWVQQFTRVSGAWIFSRAEPWTLAQQKSTVYFNPWASQMLPAFFTKLHHAKVMEEQMKWVDGLVPRDIVGLASDWP